MSDCYKFCTLLLVGIIVTFPLVSVAQTTTSVLFREDFTSLAAWKPLTFPSISRHTTYRIHREGDLSYLVAAGKNAASGLVHRRRFNVYEYPIMQWRWKINRVFDKGNVTKKSGDDYPIRLYVLFEYNSSEASLWERVKYDSIRLLYGEYPPHSTLNYIWANQPRSSNPVPSPYTSRSMMIPLNSGAMEVGEWIEHSVDIVADYQRAFGESPPARGALAIMNDSDNTDEYAESYVDYIVLQSH